MAGEACDDGNTEDGDTGVDETAGSEGSSGAGMGSSGSESSSGGETDTDTSGGAVPGDEGCNCSTTGSGTGRNSTWSVLGLFALGVFSRRRRRS
jgi:MYXO-CTERM domain-containing protein